MTRRGAIGGLLFGASFTLSGCGLIGGEKSYRFRMTVEVQTPQGVKIGSSVYRVTAGYRPDLQPGGKARQWAVQGEAVVVDLPGGQTLFALLKTGAIQGDLVGLSMTALDPAFNNDIVESAGRIAKGDGIRSPAEVAAKDYPMLIRFRESNDPKSVELVDPVDLAKTFGPGVSLRRITVTVTDDAVTSGIEKRLVMLNIEPNHGLDRTMGVTASPTLGQQLGYNDFRR